MQKVRRMGNLPYKGWRVLSSRKKKTKEKKVVIRGIIFKQ